MDYSKYDANGNKLEEIRYDWDSDSNKWVANNREVNIYDANGNRLEYIFQIWSSYINDWVGELREVTTYDTNGNQLEHSEYEWSSAINDWVVSEIQVAYWSELSTPVGPRSEYQKCIIYPNPVNNLITIETEYPDHYSLEINSLNGQQILSGEMEGTSHQLDLSSFQKGVYFITIWSEGFVTNRKIIKL